MNVYLVCYSAGGFKKHVVMEHLSSLSFSVYVLNITHMRGYIQKFLDAVNNVIYS